MKIINIRKYKFYSRYEYNSNNCHTDIWRLFLNKYKRNDFIYWKFYRRRMFLCAKDVKRRYIIKRKWRPLVKGLVWRKNYIWYDTLKGRLINYWRYIWWRRRRWMRRENKYKHFSLVISLDVKIKKRRSKRKFKGKTSKRLIMRKVFFAFFTNLTLYQLRWLCKNMKKIIFFQYWNFIDNLEFRIDMILYRSNLFKNMYLIRKYLKFKYIYINDKIIQKPYYFVKIADIITIEKKLHNFLKKKFIQNGKKGKIMLQLPRFLFLNYKILMLIVLLKPSRFYSKIKFNWVRHSKFYKIKKYRRGFPYKIILKKVIFYRKRRGIFYPYHVSIKKVLNLYK